MTASLTTHELKVGYRAGSKSTALKLLPAELTANKGELIALVGANGQGKSTLLRTLAGLQAPLSGEAVWNVNSIKGASHKLNSAQLATIISIVLPGTLRVPGLTVSDLVALGRHQHTGWSGRPSAPDRQIIHQAMELTDCQPLAHRFLDTLSDGERQRAFIARALAQDTPAILLDEPTAFLDLPHRFHIVRLLKQLAREHDKTILFSTHDLTMATDEADKLWLFGAGKITEGAPEDLAIGGAFDQLFADICLTYNSTTGLFEKKPELHKPIALNAPKHSILTTWTERAIRRLDFTISQEPVRESITLHETTPPTWTIESAKGTFTVNSLYEMAQKLKFINS